MNSIHAAFALALATASIASDGESANRLRASIYETVLGNQAPRLDTAPLGETRAQMIAPSRRTAPQPR